MKKRMNLSIDTDVIDYLHWYADRERNRRGISPTCPVYVAGLVSQAVRQTEEFKEWLEEQK
jgi:hypothetical protein